jgi:hypothetical protein
MWLFNQFEPFLKLGICKEYTSMAKAKAARSVNSEPRSKPTPVTKFKAVEDTRTDTPVDFEAEIRRRAYELYQERGCVAGHEREDWLIAEREVMSRYTLQTV